MPADLRAECRLRHDIHAGARSLFEVLRQPNEIEEIRAGMVEDCIRQHSGEYRRRALWERLPRKVMCQTFKAIIEYLLESGKIAIDAQDRVCWIYDPEFTWWYLAREDLRIR